MRILLSRTDGIGDVVLTLPMAGVIKRYIPDSKVFFLGKSYTEPIIRQSEDVDGFLNWDELGKDEKLSVKRLREMNFDTVVHVFPQKGIARLCKKAGIAQRVGTSHRLYNLLYCNRLVNFSRRKSDLHESVLNLKLLSPFSQIPKDIALEAMSSFLRLKVSPTASFADELLQNDERFKLILHPKSKGNGKEWGLDNFLCLIDLLDERKFKIFVCGTENEGAMFRDVLFAEPRGNVYDLSGRLSLEQYIDLISRADALVASGTGPLHIAAALNRHAIGLFPPIRPMNPERWQPIGQNVKVFCKETYCQKCRQTTDCSCMKSISPQSVAAYLNSLAERR